MSNKQRIGVKLREVQKVINKAEETFTIIRNQQNKNAIKNKSFDFDFYKGKLTKQYKASKSLQAKLLKMSSNSKALGLNNSERLKLLNIIKKNYYLQKRLIKFIRSGAIPIKLSPLHKIDEQSNVITLSNEFKIKEWFLDEVDDNKEPIVLGDSLRVAELAVHELIEESDTELTDDSAEDDLTEIEGITPQLERVMKDRGINSFKKLAELSDDAVRKMDKRILFRGKFKRYQWVESAQKKLS